MIGVGVDFGTSNSTVAWFDGPRMSQQGGVVTAGALMRSMTAQRRGCWPQPRGQVATHALYSAGIQEN